MSRSGLVDYYIRKVKEGNFEIDQVRKELVSNGASKEEIKAIVRQVDYYLQKRELSKTKKNHAKDFIGIGVVLSLVGVGITMGTYTEIIPSGNSFLIVYGPIIGGVSLLIGGWIEYKKQ